MNERAEFLLYLYQLCEMGVSSTKELLNILHGKENNIKVLVGEELKEYEDAFEKAKELLNECDVSPIGSGIMAKMGSTVGIHMDLMKDNSDSKVADMLIQGYTMGLLEVTKKLKKYKDYIKKPEKDLAEKIQKFHNSNIKALKSYL